MVHCRRQLIVKMILPDLLYFVVNNLFMAIWLVVKVANIEVIDCQVFLLSLD